MPSYRTPEGILLCPEHATPLQPLRPVDDPPNCPFCPGGALAGRFPTFRRRERVKSRLKRLPSLQSFDTETHEMTLRGWVDGLGRIVQTIHYAARDAEITQSLYRLLHGKGHQR